MLGVSTDVPGAARPTGCSSPRARRGRGDAVGRVEAPVDGDRVEQPAPGAQVGQHPDRGPRGGGRSRSRRRRPAPRAAGGRCRRGSRTDGTAPGAAPTGRPQRQPIDRGPVELVDVEQRHHDALVNSWRTGRTAGAARCPRTARAGSRPPAPPLEPVPAAARRVRRWDRFGVVGVAVGGTARAAVGARGRPGLEVVTGSPRSGGTTSRAERTPSSWKP